MPGDCKRERAAGIVFSGRGEGSFYVSIYARNFERALGFRPYPGTLNVKLIEKIEEFNRCLEMAKGITVEPPNIEGTRLGAVDVYKARLIRGLDEWDVFLVRPRITHYRGDVVELVSNWYLRGEVGLEDGDKVIIEVECC